MVSSKEKVVARIDFLSEQLLSMPLNTLLTELFKVIDGLDSVKGIKVWLLRITWGIYKNDVVFIRDCLQYGVKPLLINKKP